MQCPNPKCSHDTLAHDSEGCTFIDKHNRQCMCQRVFADVHQIRHSQASEIRFLQEVRVAMRAQPAPAEKKRSMQEHEELASKLELDTVSFDCERCGVPLWAVSIKNRWVIFERIKRTEHTDFACGRRSMTHAKQLLEEADAARPGTDLRR